MKRAAPEPGRNMGEPLPRVDGKLKVTGDPILATKLSKLLQMAG